jgi:hypothetical protein
VWLNVCLHAVHEFITLVPRNNTSTQELNNPAHTRWLTEERELGVCVTADGDNFAVVSLGEGEYPTIPILPDGRHASPMEVLSPSPSPSLPRSLSLFLFLFLSSWRSDHLADGENPQTVL